MYRKFCQIVKFALAVPAPVSLKHIGTCNMKANGWYEPVLMVIGTHLQGYLQDIRVWISYQCISNVKSMSRTHFGDHRLCLDKMEIHENPQQNTTVYFPSKKAHFRLEIMQIFNGHAWPLNYSQVDGQLVVIQQDVHFCEGWKTNNYHHHRLVLLSSVSRLCPSLREVDGQPAVKLQLQTDL